MLPSIDIPVAKDPNKTFLGYYTGVKGAGKKYYDGSGNGEIFGESKNITLYALFD